VFRGMFVKLGITGKESSAFGSLQIWSVCFKFNFYFLGGGHFKHLNLCGGTPKIIKILLVVPQIIDGVPTPQVFFPGKALKKNHAENILVHFKTGIVQLFKKKLYKEQIKFLSNIGNIESKLYTCFSTKMLILMLVWIWNGHHRF
jgi:hypothetical protein